jgi:Flp pilus assembly protein TadG
MHAQRGTAMVEFAIASSLMLMMLLGIIEFGRALYTYHTIENAARLGARWAIVRGSGCLDSSCPATQDTIKTYVLTQIPLLDPGSTTVTASWGSPCTSTGPGQSGCAVSVTVTYDFSFDVPMIGGSPQISSTSTMTVAE